MCNSMYVSGCIHIYGKRKIDHILESCLSRNTLKKLFLKKKEKKAVFFFSFKMGSVM